MVGKNCMSDKQDCPERNNDNEYYNTVSTFAHKEFANTHRRNVGFGYCHGFIRPNLKREWGRRVPSQPNLFHMLLNLHVTVLIVSNAFIEIGGVVRGRLPVEVVSEPFFHKVL